MAQRGSGRRSKESGQLPLNVGLQTFQNQKGMINRAALLRKTDEMKLCSSNRYAISYSVLRLQAGMQLARRRHAERG